MGRKLYHVFSLVPGKGLLHAPNLPVMAMFTFAAGLATGSTVYFTLTKPDFALDRNLNHNHRHWRIDFNKSAKFINPHGTSQYVPPPQWLTDLRKEIGSGQTN